MDFKVIWSDSAISDLKDICNYIDRDKPKAAERVGRGILNTVKLLETFPLLGPAYPRRSSGRIRELFLEITEFFMKCSTRKKLFMCCESGTGHEMNQ